MLQNCRLEPLGMRIYQTGEVKIRATPLQNQDHTVVSMSKKRNLLKSMITKRSF